MTDGAFRGTFCRAPRAPEEAAMSQTIQPPGSGDRRAAEARTDGDPARSERERRVLDWITKLADLPERAAGTSSEREAAARVGSWMEELGVSEVRLEPVVARPRSGWALAVHGGAAAVGVALGGFAGAVLAVGAALSFRSELRRRSRWLSRILSAPESVSVVGHVPSSRPARTRVVLSAHIDSAQAGWLFAQPVADFFAARAQRARRPGAPPPGPNALPEALLVFAAVVATASWLGASGLLVGLAQAAAGLGTLLIAVLGAQWALAPSSPGANDNASAVAAMLTCAEQLLAQLPPDVEVWIVGTGAEEVGCCGMHALLEAHPEWTPDDTFFVNFECVGGGALHWIRSEGTLGKTGYPPLLVELARRVAASGAFGDVTPTDLLAGTDAHVPAGQGFPSLSLISLERNGVPRNYHRLDDVPAGIDLATVVRAADFGAAVAASAIRGDAGPITII